MKAPMLRRVLAPVRRVFLRARELFPFTPLGVILLAGAALALVRYGLRRIDLVLLVIGAVGLALGAITLLVTAITAVALWASLRKQGGGETVRLECGYAARTGFSLSSLWFVPLVKVSWQWESPEASVALVRMRRRDWEEVTPLRRGMHDVIVRRFEVGDALGLTRIVFRAREDRGVRFTPSVGALKQMHVVRSIAGGDNLSHPAGPPEGERADMRHYAQGDPIKFVLWKVYARSRQLVVRTPERAISPVRQTVAYVVTGVGDEPAAGAARVAVDSGALGREWVLGADGNRDYARSAPEALEVLARSASTATDDGGVGLAEFLRTATPGSVGRAVVFVPSTPGPWLDRVVACAAARSAPNQPYGPVEFVVCTDGISRAQKGSWWRRLALDLRPEGPGTPGPEVQAIVKRLAGARSRVMVVDRLAGRVYSEGHMQSVATGPS